VDPTTPMPSLTEGEFTWRLVSHLSLNHYSLVDDDGGHGAVALRELLKLYGDLSRKDVQQEIESLVSVKAQPVTRRLPSAGPIAFGRGLEVALTFDEDRMEGLGLYSIGLVLARFMARYVSINSFAETVIHSQQRGEVIQWRRLNGLSPIA
jgi:type VI secretion system protein ImpG